MLRGAGLRHLLFALLLAAVTCAAYSNSFQVPFVFDDFVNIIDKKSIRTFSPNLAGIISAASEGLSGKRWLPNLSLALNYYWGSEAVFGYHLVNLLIHLGCALVLYLLCLTTLRLPSVLGKGEPAAASAIAMAATLIWAVHPLQTNAVTYLVQRMTSLCALFYLATLLCYVKGRLHPSSAPRRYGYWTAGLLFAGMAVTSKENALMLPVVVLAYEYYFLRGPQGSPGNRKAALGWLTASLALILILAAVYLGTDIFATVMAGYKQRDFTLAERLLTESRVIFLYLSLLALPLPSRLNLNHDIVVSHGLLSPPQTLLSLLGLIFLCCLIVWSFNRNRLLSFALLWFLLNLAIESTIVPLELVFEHRLYLPSTILVLGCVSLLFHLLRTRPWLPGAASLALIVLLSLWTWQRNQVWTSSISLWSDVVAKSPGLARGYVNLGVAYHDVNDFKMAQSLFETAIRMDPQSRTAYLCLGSMFLTQDKLDQAEQTLLTALSKQRYLSPARLYHYLGVLYRKKASYPAAINYSRMALQLESEDLQPLINLGIVYEKMGDYRLADATFGEALRSGLNDSVDLFNNWGIAVYKLGQTDRAIEYFKEGLQIDPGHPETHYNLGLAYGQKGMIKEAQAEMRLSMQLRQQQN